MHISVNALKNLTYGIGNHSWKVGDSDNSVCKSIQGESERLQFSEIEFKNVTNHRRTVALNRALRL
jgi:hypothetical protein